MGQTEVEITADDVANAIIETEREIAGAAWGDEETEALDASGDRSLEDQGEGLEGQHEVDEDEEVEETESDEETEGEDDEGEGDAKAAAEKSKDKTEPPVKPAAEQQPQGRIPPGRLREANERARTAEAERDAERAARAEERSKIAALEAQMQTLTQLLQGQRQPPQKTEQQTAPEPKKAPDMFENPDGFVEHIVSQIRSEVGGVRNDLRQQRVETSFQLAHVRHAEAFPKAMEAIGRLDANNPDDRVTVQRIYNSPDPGEALVNWHRRNETLARVGNDPAAYEEKIRNDTRQALMNDPEFKKQLLDSLRADALAGDDGRPRTTNRLPRSLARAAGSNVGANSGERLDGSDQAVADSAWR